jgi:amidase
MDDFLSAAAHELAAAIRRREVSSVEIVSAHLVHIGRHNPRLNAVVTLDADGAGLYAREADEALERGEVWGPLHGVPITLEDCHPTSGMRSTWGGLPRLADHVPERDGAVAARLKGAGAVLLGKTNGPEVWPDPVFPRTNNPWDLTRTPGGFKLGAGGRGGRRVHAPGRRAGYPGLDPEPGPLLRRLRLSIKKIRVSVPTPVELSLLLLHPH